MSLHTAESISFSFSRWSDKSLEHGCCVQGIYRNLYQFWLPPAVLLLAVSVWRRAGRAVLGSLLMVSVNVWLLGWHWAAWSGAAWSGAAWQAQAAHPGTPNFRLMTYNVARGGAGERAAGQSAAEALAAAVLAQRPDVICLQEINGLQPTLFPELLRRLPGYTAVPSREVAILTRFPVLERQETALPGTGRRLLSAALKVQGVRVTVLNAHFTTIPLRGGWTAARDARDAQLRALLGAAQTTPGPLLACGDFNTPAHGRVYGELKRHFANAFEQAGSGFGYTFPASFPLVRIDHVWLRGAHATRGAVPESRASDHRPLVVDPMVP